MACETFTCDALTYDDITVEMMSIWADMPDKMLEYPGASAMKLLENQGMRAVEEITVGGRCTGWRGYWIEECNTEGANKGGEFPIGTEECDFPEPKDEAVCQEIDYNRNCFIDTSFSFTDQDCSSRLNGISIAAMKFDKAFERMRKAISESVFDLMTANAQANTWALTYGNPVGTVTEFTSNEFTVNLLHHFRNIARHHQCPDYCVLDDTNFWELWQQLLDGKCCGDESGRTTFDRFDITFDPWIDEYLGRRSTFLVNPKQYGFINTWKYNNESPIMQFNNGEDSIYVWSVSDPVLQILTIGENGQTSLQPVRYDVEYKKKCCGRDALGNRMFKHNYFITYSGGQWTAPNKCGKGSCTFEFVNVG